MFRFPPAAIFNFNNLIFTEINKDVIYIPVFQGHEEGDLNYFDTVLMLATFLTSQEQGLH